MNYARTMRALRRRRDRTADPSIRLLAIALAGGRLAIGAGIWLAPARALRALGFDPATAQVRALGRLAATRDLATGALAVAALGDADSMRRVALANAAIDAGDALAFAIALSRREGLDRAALGGAVGGASGAVGGALLARRLS